MGEFAGGVWALHFAVWPCFDLSDHKPPSVFEHDLKAVVGEVFAVYGGSTFTAKKPSDAPVTPSS